MIEMVVIIMPYDNNNNDQLLIVNQTGLELKRMGSSRKDKDQHNDKH
jgi:hypothetical protein